MLGRELVLLVFSCVYRAVAAQADCVCGVSPSSGVKSCDSKFDVKIIGGNEADVKIIGGSEADVNEFPWAVLLEIKDEGSSIQDPLRCGGSLINDRYVLTAAHCVVGSNPTITAILGEHDTASRIESTALRIQAKPYVFNKHWSYNYDLQQGVSYDFTLLELSERVDFSLYPHIRPVCLPDKEDEDYENEIATVVGWGLRNVDYRTFTEIGLVKGIGYEQSQRLKKLDVRLMSQKECRDDFHTAEPSIKITESNLCAVALTGDTCKGDSGGGMVRPNCQGSFSIYELVGVVSFGIGCNSTANGVKIPGVYARVSIVVDWIKQLTEDGIFCKKPSEKGSGWGEWTEFTGCDKSCGVGKKTRHRFCSHGCSHSQQTQDRPCLTRKC